MSGHVTVNNIEALTPGTGASNLGKAEDAAHTSGDTGVMLLAVRKDTAAALAATDGDYIPLIVDATGRLYIASAQLPTALAANGGIKVEGVAGGTAVPVSVASLPARAATTDSVTAKLATDAVMNGLTALTPKFALANTAASQTDSSVVAAVAAKKIRVLAAAALAGATATTLTFNSKGGGAGVAISCLFANAANGGEVLPFNPVGWFETVVGEALTCTTGAGTPTGIQVVYVEV